jgi:hypothetical protein
MTPAYASFDVETDGGNPMQHSMRSIGVALFNKDAALIDTFYRTLQPQKHATVDSACKRDFWDKHPEAWAHVNSRPSPIRGAMEELSAWLTSHAANYEIKWVANPSNFDWMFLKCYYDAYGPETRFDIGYFCHDLASLVRAYMIMSGKRDKQALLTELSGGHAYTHHALDDAIYQGHVYMNLRRRLQFFT